MFFGQEWQVRTNAPNLWLKLVALNAPLHPATAYSYILAYFDKQRT